jgi:hypothetical protein
MEVAAEVEVTATELGFTNKYLAPALRSHPAAIDADSLRGSVADLLSSPTSPMLSSSSVNSSEVSSPFGVRDGSGRRIPLDDGEEALDIDDGDETSVSGIARDLVQLDELDRESSSAESLSGSGSSASGSDLPPARADSSTGPRDV